MNSTELTEFRLGHINYSSAEPEIPSSSLTEGIVTTNTIGRAATPGYFIVTHHAATVSRHGHVQYPNDLTFRSVVLQPDRHSSYAMIEQEGHRLLPTALRELADQIEDLLDEGDEEPPAS